MIKFLVLVFIFCASGVVAQCPVVDFTTPATACTSERINIQNSATVATAYEWDFCSGDLSLTPAAQAVVSSSSFFRARVFRTLYVNNVWFGFAIDQPSNTLVRFRFGASLENIPQVVSLGNPSSSFQNPLDISFWNEGTIWFALVANTNGNSVLLLNFGNDIESTPSVTNIGSLSGAIKSPAGVFIAKEGNSLSAFVTNSSAPEVVRLDFGSSITNTPLATIINVAGSAPRAIAITLECDRWYGIITSYGTGQLYYLDFIDGLMQTPSVGLLNIPSASYSFPASISISNEGANFYAFVQSAFPANIYRIDFGTSIIDGNGTFSNLGNLGISTDNSPFDLVNYESRWHAFSIDLSGSVTPGSGRLMRLDFPDNCAATISVYKGENPPLISYASSGNYRIAQKVENAGVSKYLSKNVLIGSSFAPDINFSSQNICANHNVNFTSQNSSGDIIGYDWDFGDTNSSTQANPIHQYASNGEYQIELEVTAGNGCKNLAQQSLTIYNEPTTDFTTPSVSPICTNQNFTFDNTSTVDVGYPPAWEWKVNGSAITTNEDLSYAFTSTSNQEIRLKASIPGCENEMIKNINTLVDGPTPDFSFAGQCEEENITFTNNSSGTVSGYSWNFDDGQSSTDPNPMHSFSNQGVYDVMLTASNVAGCNNTITKSVTIYSKPQVNFHVLQPPFSCSGTPTELRDDTPSPTDSNLSAWQWNFGDTGSSENTSTLKNPQHVYSDAGVYDASLTVFTNFLCSSTLQLPLTISQTPLADFNYSPACEDVPVNFSDVSVGTIQSWDWQIGSSPYSTQSPAHTFVNAGNTNATLTVTASNNCVGSVNKPIVVPVKLVPNFSVTKNCVDQQTLFTDLTNAAADSVSSHSWNFGSVGTASGSSANFTFTNTGNVNVTLIDITQSGCIYRVTKPTNIIASPQASFTATLEPSDPLDIQFMNASVNATTYLWTFNDGNNFTSTEVSPMFTYQSIGEYMVSLIASNAQNCTHTFSKTITTVVNIALSGLELMEFQNGAIKPAVTIFNRGNVSVKNLGLLLDISGSVIREYLGTTILSNSSSRHVLQFEIPDLDGMEYICVGVDVEDITPDDNKACLNFEQSFTTFAPHPNPSNGELNVNWIVNEDGFVNLTLVNSMGQSVKNFQISSQEGLNPFILNTSGLGSGVYFLKINYQHITKVYRIFISE